MDSLYREMCSYLSVFDRTMHIVWLVQDRSHGNIYAYGSF